jgi:hypothetical protein
MTIPAKDNVIQGQTVAGVTADVFVPGDTKPGTYEATVTVEAAREDPVVLPLRVVVYDVRIPDELNFNPELNCYAGPGKAGSKHFFESHRLAHYHRCTINRVPYRQNGLVNADMIPKTDGKGGKVRVTDWSGYDRNVGPILTGEAFRGNPREGVPVRTFYLPLFESWPLHILKHYKPGAPISGKDWRQRHNMLAKPIDESLDDEYKDGFVAVTRQFVGHFEAKGYTRTMVEMYLNNKPNKERMVSTAWTLDEPTNTLDWLALKFYGLLYQQGIADQKNTQFAYRGDISRPQWQGDIMDGVMDVMYANSGQFNMPRVLAAWKKRTNGVLYCYGSCNPLSRGGKPLSNYESAAWCLKAYVHGCDGVLPWLSLFPGDEVALDSLRVDRQHFDIQNGLLVDGKRFGIARVASYRVFALREGAQLVEMLRLLAAKRDWTRTQMGMLVNPKVSLGTQFSQAFADEAAALDFGEVSGNSFVQLREGLLKMLTE